MMVPKNTREVITYAQKYISGRTLVLGVETGKYREIIKRKASNCLFFDIAPLGHLNTFENGIFETVVSTEALEHVEKPWIIVKEIFRVLNANGTCILTVPFLLPYHSDRGDYFRYSADGIRSLFQNEGFEIMECSSYGQPFSVLSEFIRFSWFSPSEKRKKGSWKITHFIAAVARFLNKFTKNKIIYSSVYIVAKKK